jgi:CIC family chloride channel protein
MPQTVDEHAYNRKRRSQRLVARRMAVLDRHRKLVRSYWSSEAAGTAGLALVVGGITGRGAVGFIEIIALCQRLFFDGGASAFSALGGWYVVLLPVLGGLIVGPLVHFLAPEARGHGVPEVMTAMETRGGRIRPVVVLVKTIGSAITIGSGGSAGREGPIVQIGAGVGSVVGQVLRISRPRLLALVGAGAAGGIAATFNAPIAGVMFTLEVLVGEFNVVTVSSMVFASVSASVVSRLLLGDYPAFHVPAYELVSNWELVMYLGLGVAAAFVALLYVRSLYFAEDIFERWTIPGWLKPPIAGVAIGLIGYFLPQVFGTGFAAMDSVLRGQLGLWLVVGLIFARIAATSLTLGSGFSGGVFAPALFIGAMLGSSYGRIMHSLFPSITATSGAYATVGMAAVFAAAARAPVTAIVILFEMTLDYKIMLPLMFATVVATLIAARIEPESIYTLKLVRRGIDFLGHRVGSLHPISVKEAMTPLKRVGTVEESLSTEGLRVYFREREQRGAIVVDADGRLTGVVTMGDLERALVSERENATVADISSSEVVTAYSDDTLDEVVKQAGMLELGYIPVVTREEPKIPIGILMRSDIIRAYGTAISRRDRHRVSFERRRAEHVFGLRPFEFVLQEGDPAVGRRLLELSPPPESVIVSVIRGETTMIPRGSTILRAGDRIMALALAHAGPILGRILKGRNYR